MTASTPIRLAAALLLGATLLSAAQAESFASSASSAGSASSGSISDSLRGSSNSSQRDRNNLAGDYRVIDVAALPGRAGMLRLTMQLAAAQAAGEDVITLDLPQAALGARGMAVGDTVRANERPYGYEFARGDTREAFFLALADDWMRDLQSQQVAL